MGRRSKILFLGIFLAFTLSQAEAKQASAGGEIDPFNVGGAVVGTITGFGLGHPFQGRYFERGWIFTLTQIVGGLMWLAGGGFGDCGARTAEGCRNETQIGIGGAIYLGSRGWEIYDLWTHLRDQPPSVGLMPSPITKDPLLAVRLNF